MKKLFTLFVAALTSAVSAAPLTLTLSLTDGKEPFFYHNPLKVGEQSLNVQEVKFYVSEVALVRADGSEVPVAGLQLAHLKKGTPPQNIEIFRGNAPVGDYRGVRFSVGVPRHLNHRDATTAKAPLNVEQGMYWAWNSGYIFFSLLGDVDGQKVANHVGGDSHRVTVNLADLQKPTTGLKLGAQGATIPVNLDLQKLYAAGVAGQPWDFAKAQYQQVHMGPAADQLFMNLSGAFSRAEAPAPAAAGQHH